jgi:predicted dehydrogenase
MNEAGAVRWGIVSTARINAKLLAGAREATGVDVVAVGSRDRARGEEFAAEYGIGRVHTPTSRCSRTTTSRRSTSRCRTRSMCRGR